MRKHSKITNQEVTNISDKVFWVDRSKENREILERVLADMAELEVRMLEEETKDFEMPPLGRRHMIRMNRVFRERVGGTYLPYPGVDNLFERIRSKLVIKLKINEFLSYCKERRYEK